MNVFMCGARNVKGSPEKKITLSVIQILVPQFTNQKDHVHRYLLEVHFNKA